MTPAGRPAGQSDKRARILDAARELFSSKGFDQTSMRAIAGAAGVDVALISHYFGNKRGLFLEMMQLPLDPADILAPLQDVSDDQLGETFLREVLTAWDSPAGPAAVAVFRSGMAGDDTMLREFMLGVVLVPLRERVEAAVGDSARRLPLVASQLAGLLVVRKVLAVEPLASMTIDEVVSLFAPTVQHFLTGELPG